jgi:hypothetical protein
MYTFLVFIVEKNVRMSRWYFMRRNFVAMDASRCMNYWKIMP